MLNYEIKTWRDQSDYAFLRIEKFEKQEDMLKFITEDLKHETIVSIKLKS